MRSPPALGSASQSAGRRWCVRGRLGRGRRRPPRGALGGAIGYGVAGYDEITPERLSELLHITPRLDPGTFFDIFARMVHDKLNREGVEVTNGIDPPWRLSGDATLNDTSLAIGRKAVQESEKNLEEAAKTVGNLSLRRHVLARAWKFVPHPTEDGQKFIDKVRDDLTNAATRRPSTRPTSSPWTRSTPRSTR